MAEQLTAGLKVLRFRQATGKIGLGRSTVYDKLNPKSPRYDATFPRPITLGSGKRVRAVGFLEGELDSWLDRQIQQSRSSALDTARRAA